MSLKHLICQEFGHGEHIHKVPERVVSELVDSRLFREACYVEGRWVQGSSGQMLNGREGSKYGMDEFVEIKYMRFGGITA